MKIRVDRSNANVIEELLEMHIMVVVMSLSNAKKMGIVRILQNALRRLETPNALVRDYMIIMRF